MLASADLGYQGSVESVLVTARHVQEDVQHVPVAVDVLNSVQIEKTGQFTINQLQISVPSLYAATSNARNAAVNIRGLGSNTTIANDGLENGVGFYIDGVYYGRVGLSQFDLLDLEQVEVLHGPQGTLFGKNTTAGALNITTRKPTTTPEAQFVLQGGDFGFYQGAGSVSGGLLDDKLAGRLSFGYTSRGGYVKNITLHTNVRDYVNSSVRGQLLGNFTENLELRFIADFQRQVAHTASTDDGVVTTYDNGAPVADNIITKAARFGYTLPTNSVWSRITDVNSPVQANMEQWGVSLQADWKIAGGTLTSITAYRAWNWYPLNDSDGTPLSAITLSHIVDHQQQFSQELRYAGEVSNDIDYQAGLYYFWQIVDGYTQFKYGKDAPLFYFPAVNPIYTAALSGYHTGAVSNPQTRSYAAFGQANWHITPELTLTGGLRYTYEDKNGIYDNRVLEAADISGFTPAQQATILAVRANFSRVWGYSSSLHNGNLSSLVTLAYQIDPDVLTYATWSQGEKSGGLNLANLPTTLTDPRVKPEKVDNYELGLKSKLFDGSLVANLAAYWTEVGDYQTLVYSLQPPYQSAINNIPRVRSRGFETSFLWAPLDKVGIGLGTAYTDATYLSYQTGPTPAERGPLATFPFTDLSGKPLASVSKWVITATIDAAQSLGLNGPSGIGPLEAYVHADTRYQSSLYTNASDSRYSRVPAYDLTNLRIGLRTEDSGWDLSLFSNNLLNQRYYLSRSLATTGLITGLAGDPRNSGITLRIKY